MALAMLDSLLFVSEEFYSEENNLEVPKGYLKLNMDPFSEPSKLVHPMLDFPRHREKDS